MFGLEERGLLSGFCVVKESIQGILAKNARRYLSPRVGVLGFFNAQGLGFRVAEITGRHNRSFGEAARETPV